jgi:uncharacterized protein YegJ (DUF2314 family)
MRVMDILILNVIMEYEEFKALELTKTAEELFVDAEKIYFYKSMHEFFVMFEFNEGSYIAEELKQICYKRSAKDVNLIEHLWFQYLKYDGVSVSSFSQIEEFLDLATF